MDKVLYLAITYPLGGILLGSLHWLLRIMGFLEVRDWENFPKFPRKVMVISNHPSKNRQPLLTVGLFFHAYWRHPFLCGPYSVADKKNFYDRWVFAPFRARIVPVNRENPDDDKCLEIVAEIAKEGGNQIWFPEGTRTSTGRKKGKRINKSPNGRGEMVQLKTGFARVVSEHNYTIIPIWCDIQKWKIVMTVGEPLSGLGGLEKKTIVNVSTNALFTLADR